MFLESNREDITYIRCNCNFCKIEVSIRLSIATSIHKNYGFLKIATMRSTYVNNAYIEAKCRDRNAPSTKKRNCAIVEQL